LLLELKSNLVYSLISEGGRQAVEIFVGQFDCRSQNHQQGEPPPWARISKKQQLV